MPARLPPSLAQLQSDQTVICAHFVPAMQRIADALRGGYVHHVSGSVALAQASRLVEKLQTRFPGLGQSKYVAYRNGRAGRARHKLIVFANRASSTAIFHLLTDRPQEEDRENWCDARRKASRLQLYQYEALQATKAGTSGTVWTWQIQRSVVDELKALARISIRAKKAVPVEVLIQESRTWPGFSGVRLQRVALASSITAEWRRTMPSNLPPPEWPRLRYVQRVRTR